MKLTPLTLLLLLCAPAAAAGGLDASVTYAEGDASCGSGWGSHHGQNSSDDHSFRYAHSWYDHGCSDAFTYGSASVRDDDGEVVSAGADARSAHDAHARAYEADEWTNGYSSASRGDSSSNDSAWSRDAHLHTREGSADASYGCAASAASGYHSGGWWTSDASSSHGSSSTAYAERSTDGCAAGATARRGDETVTATPFRNGCESTWDYWNSHQQTSNGGWTQADHASGYSDARSCATTASVGAGDASASGGLVDACRARAYEREQTETHEGNVTWAQRWSDSSSDCHRGVVVQGPDGIVLFVGEEWGSHECSAPDCASSYHQAGARLTWAHNPLGPSPQGVLVSLP